MDILAALKAEQDQDRAGGISWWNASPAWEKVKVWDEIQRQCDSENAMQQILGRFAQVGMTEIALASQEPTNG